MTVRTITVDEEERRQRRIVIGLFLVVLVGLGYILYDYFRISTRPLPEDPALLEPIIMQWKSDGFVRDFDISKTMLVVDEEKWSKRRREEKTEIVAILARYCAGKNKSPRWLLQVVSQKSGAVLGELGKLGLRIS